MHVNDAKKAVFRPPRGVYTRKLCFTQFSMY